MRDDLLPNDLCDLGVRLADAPAPAGEEGGPSIADADALDALYASLLPGHKVQAAAVGLPVGARGRHLALACVPADAPQAVAAAALAGGCVGLAVATAVDGLVGDGVLAAAEDAGCAILLPPLGPQRLLAEASRLDALCEEHPALRFVLTRCGGCLCANELREAWEALPLQAENLHLGLDLVQDWEQLRVLLRQADRDRLVWGSGLPLAAERGTIVAIAGRAHRVTAEPRPWSLHYAAGGPALDCGTMLAAGLDAFTTAAAKVGLKATEAHAVMHGNALRLCDRE